jgi:arylsulfatase A-like enzyme/Tfp pilus assembly protein PilF
MQVLPSVLSFGLLLELAFAAPPATRPNVIVITLDTTRADRMGFLGSDRGLTPNLDALAKQSIVFSRAYSHVPLTPPSHATILTGTYPQYSHLRYMGEPLQKDLPYLPDLLHRRGYHTAAFVGSMILDPKNVTAFGFERGFEAYDAGFHKKKKDEDRYKSVERRADDVVTHTLNWLSKHPSGPYFLWVHCYDPHGPYDPPGPYKSKFSDPYDGEIAYMDAALGHFVAGLKTRGLYKSAIIAVTADHGEAFGEHGERHHGVFLYDETMHVPLLIKLPGERLAGTRVEARARLVDIAPTILQLCKIPVPPAIQGESLLPLLKPASGDRGKEDRPAFGESIYAHRAFGWSVLRSWRSGKYLYVQAPEPELYDQNADPKAVHNFADSAKAVTGTLSAQLNQFWDKTSAADGIASNLNSEQAESLRALGYLASTNASNSKNDQDGPDPKNKIEVANLLTEALFEAQEGSEKDAVPKLEKVLAMEPNSSLAYLELGRTFLHQKNYEQALPLLKEAVARLPEDGSARYEFGRALVETHQWADAAPQFEAALQHTPKSAELHFDLAVVYERTQRLSDAIREFQNTVALDSNHFRANLFLGRLLGMQNRASEALPYLKEAAKIQPDSVDAHQFLANIYKELGQDAKAQQERAEAERLRSPGAHKVPHP